LEFQLIRVAQAGFSTLTPVIECYYTTTPTDYPSTTRGMSVGHTVTVNIDFCGYLRFFIVLTERYVYSTPLTTYSVTKYCSLYGPVLIFQPPVISWARKYKHREVLRTIITLDNSVQQPFGYVMNNGFRRVQGVGEGMHRCTVKTSRLLQQGRNCRISILSEQIPPKTSRNVR
jgi:hypothetical protein